MDRGRGRGANPWKTGNQNNNKNDAKTTKETVEQRFQKERDKLQAFVKKLEPVDSSSEEEEDGESGNILDTVLQKFLQMGGGDLGRTRQFLNCSFQSGAGVCLICIASIKRADPVWNCVECYGCFHIICIQKWSRDSLFQQKQALEDLPLFRRSCKLTWGCPKCRRDYEDCDIPSRYWCYCTKAEDPPHHPWLIPHSCGDICDRPLVPDCGHRCLLLCHPGPCPPCPKTVKTKCYCRKAGPAAKRCSEKYWSCQQPCGSKLACNKHVCNSKCHPDSCPPCPQQSQQFCDCGLQRTQRLCSEPTWKCDKVCGKPFSCGHHTCEVVCHSGPCGECPLSLIRSCPCGKTQGVVACTQEMPTCNDTCGKLMECSVHKCQLKCHKDKCACLEIVRKVCRCGQHQKDVPCGKEYTCETKCKRTKTCLRHPCNRKCCDGVCPPCEKPCGRTLTCGTHKCPSVCHRGACYPCPQMAIVRCRCGFSTISVPCGRERRTKPPRCKQTCKIPPDCDHEARLPHPCHFGDCPPCKQVCAKLHVGCGHPCPAPCHSNVLLKVDQAKRPAGPWELSEPAYRRCALPCPSCVVPVPVTCLGHHETAHLPCSNNSRYSCGRPCGKSLKCGNHFCTEPCHGELTECRDCELPCSRPRPPGCSHPCTLPCHTHPCSTPCTIDVKVTCHCGIGTLYIACYLVGEAQYEGKMDNLSCGNRCPNVYGCGHKCRSNCHPGDCPDPGSCRKKVKLSCSCGRMKKEFTCDIVRRGEAKIVCDDVCVDKKEQDRMAKELEIVKKQEEAARKNREELEKFEKKFQGKKKVRDRRRTVEDEEPSWIAKYWLPSFAVSFGITAVVIYFIFLNN